jgi:hypothetical protein
MGSATQGNDTLTENLVTRIVRSISATQTAVNFCSKRIVILIECFVIETGKHGFMTSGRVETVWFV